MRLEEATEILKDNGYILEATRRNSFMDLLWQQLMILDKNDILDIHSYNPSKWIDIDFAGDTVRVYRTSAGINGEFSTGRKFNYKVKNPNLDVAHDCAGFLISIIQGEMSDIEAREKLNNY